MKKVVLFIISILLGCFVLTGCTDDGAPFSEKSYTPDTNIDKIVIDVRDRKIDVVPSYDEQIHIQYSENSKEYYSIVVSDEHVLTMTGANSKEWKDYVGEKAPVEARTIILQIPDGSLENLTIATINEDISLPPLAVCESIVLNSNGGNIAFDNLDVGNQLSLTVKNGDITGNIIGSYDDFAIQTEVEKGDSNLPQSKPDGAKSLAISCNHGSVNINFIPE